MLLSASALAQDAHYNTRQFGNRAWLLGGAFVGNPDDISAVYYNPGALGLLSAPELELTGSVYEYTRLSVVDGRGPGRDLGMSDVSALPSMVAGSLRFGFLGRSQLAYSLLTRQGFSYELEARGAHTGTDLAGVSGMDALSTDVLLEQSVSEIWAGLTWALPVGKHLGVGLSPFLAFREQELRLQVLAEGSGDAGQRLLATLGRDVQLKHLRLLLKLGICYQQAPWAVGVTVTTPSAGLWGLGSTGYQRSLVTQGFDTGSAPASVFDFQDGLSGHFRNPWSAALGVSRTFGRSTVHLSVEGFARLAPFTLVDSAPFVPRDSSEVIDPDFDLALAPVVNVALGLEQRLGAKVRAYLSGHTDFSAQASTPGTNASLAGWDLYHASTGFHFRVGRSRFTLGTDAAWGRKRTDRLSVALQQTGLSTPVQSHQVRYFQATVLIGASFALIDKRETAGEAGAGDDSDAEAK
ncbi:hypothetical protein [Corallococcus terminator]|uniref:Aromatic hydrocarbon degradation protein n=1 Tax=Corallococcus terminator TaxID=2316733 RepID=A0A3A8J5P6_9BACT|nr:hypothetical protein [Corallococcus terminator]RKG84863.1 hypothetical protein D7V88_21050 [Corallococcus terminator]